MDLNEDRTRKRSLNACVRCRRHKIKCGGKHPCDPCIRRRLACDYEADEPKIFVSKKYLSDLQNKVALLEAQLASPSMTSSMASPRLLTVAESLEQPSTTCELHEKTPVPRQQQESFQITDPLLSSEYLTHVTDQEGTPHHLGHSSNYSFTQRVLRLLHSRISPDPYPPSNWHPCGSYDLGWNGLRTPVKDQIGSLPSIYHAIFLLNAVKFHAGQIYHMFDEVTFMPQLHQFYTNPAENVHIMKIWYIHFLVLLAFGKAFVVCETQGVNPPGSDLFVRAARLLPEATYLFGDFIAATEILSCMALYYQALDGRVAAYEKIGQAARMGLTAGMHTSMQPNRLNEAFIQRCRRLWWTVVILDRQISATLGLPIQIRDEDITAPLPSFPDSEKRAAAMEIQVGLSRALVQVVKAVYSGDAKNSTSFISRTQDALRYVASVADGLSTHFILPAPYSGDGISPNTGHLNILYHQCVVVATRPFLYIFLEKQMSSSEDELSSIFQKDPIRQILIAGIDSAKTISSILFSLKSQHLIEKFLPFELESAFSAGTVLAIGSTHFPVLFQENDASLQTIIDILQIMTAKGNRTAMERLSELQAVKKMLEDTKNLFRESQQFAPVSEKFNNSDAPNPPLSRDSCEDMTRATSWVEGSTAGVIYSQPHQLTAIAESLNSWDSADWYSTMFDDSFVPIFTQ